MTYNLLKFLHLLGAILMGAGLIGVWMADLRSRQLRDLGQFADAVRNIAVFYDGLVVPGALALLVSGSWMIVEFYGGWAFLGMPWLAGMVVLFLIEFIEGNTVTRLYFLRLRRMTRDAMAHGKFTPELERKRGKLLHRSNWCDATDLAGLARYRNAGAEIRPACCGRIATLGDRHADSPGILGTVPIPHTTALRDAALNGVT